MIGQGAYGIVYKGKKEDTGDTVAIKRIPFADSTPEGGVPCNVIREISLLRELDHPNVVKLYDVYEDESHICLVMELMQGGELFDQILEKEQFSEIEAREACMSILDAIDYCHS